MATKKKYIAPQIKVEKLELCNLCDMQASVEVDPINPNPGGEDDFAKGRKEFDGDSKGGLW